MVVEVHQGRDEQQRDGLVEVEGSRQRRIGEDLLRLLDVGHDEFGLSDGRAVHQGPGVGEHELVVVDVEHPALGRDLLCHLMCVRRWEFRARCRGTRRIPRPVTRCRTARPRYALLARAMAGRVGIARTIASPSARSAARLSLPPSQQS